MAAKNGRSGGSQSWVTAYVDPHTTGGTAVRAMVASVGDLSSMEETLSSMEDKVESMDHAATVVEQWRAERPELDTSPVLVIGRIHRIAAALTPELVEVYERHGLGEGDFDVLGHTAPPGRPLRPHPGRARRAHHGDVRSGHQAGRPARGQGPRRAAAERLGPPLATRRPHPARAAGSSTRRWTTTWSTRPGCWPVWTPTERTALADLLGRLGDDARRVTQPSV